MLLPDFERQLIASERFPNRKKSEQSKKMLDDYM